jgi:EAL domain-containing protein (putative c-di-GMP-specific phosphodiesterase class I)
VENRAQLEFLRAHGCEQIQGYYFSRPLPASGIPELSTGNAFKRLLGPNAGE